MMVGTAAKPLMTSPPLSRADLTRLAMRCWRGARDAGAPVQRRLYAVLAQVESGVLAPVFDALLLACEAALGRRIETGTANAPSADEQLVVAMLEGSRTPHACVTCDAQTASMLDCAICSTRIMLNLARG